MSVTTDLGCGGSNVKMVLRNPSLGKTGSAGFPKTTDIAWALRAFNMQAAISNGTRWEEINPLHWWCPVEKIFRVS